MSEREEDCFEEGRVKRGKE